MPFVKGLGAVLLVLVVAGLLVSVSGRVLDGITMAVIVLVAAIVGGLAYRASRSRRPNPGRTP